MAHKISMNVRAALLCGASLLASAPAAVAQTTFPTQAFCHTNSAEFNTGFALGATPQQTIRGLSTPGGSTSFSDFRVVGTQFGTLYGEASAEGIPAKAFISEGVLTIFYVVEGVSYLTTAFYNMPYEDGYRATMTIQGYPDVGRATYIAAAFCRLS